MAMNASHLDIWRIKTMFKYMYDKDKILKDLYYNESGSQSINNLYKEAKEKR